MPKGQRQPVNLTQEHMERYVELKRQGRTVPQSIALIQQEFNMPNPHTRQAVDLRFKKLRKVGKGLETTAVSGPSPAQIVDIKEKGSGTTTPSLLEELISAAELGCQNQVIFDFLMSNDTVRKELAEQVKVIKQVPGLKHELRQYKAGYNNWKDTAARLEKENQKLRQGKLAYQQGDVNPPLSGGGKPSKLILEPSK